MARTAAALFGAAGVATLLGLVLPQRHRRASGIDLDGHTAEELVRAADAALYAAKRSVEPLAPPAR